MYFYLEIVFTMFKFLGPPLLNLPFVICNNIYALKIHNSTNRGELYV